MLQYKEPQVSGIAGLHTRYKALNSQNNERIKQAHPVEKATHVPDRNTLARSLLRLPELPDAKKEFKTTAMKL